MNTKLMYLSIPRKLYPVATYIRMYVCRLEIITEHALGIYIEHSEQNYEIQKVLLILVFRKLGHILDMYAHAYTYTYIQSYICTYYIQYSSCLSLQKNARTFCALGKFEITRM